MNSFKLKFFSLFKPLASKLPTLPLTRLTGQQTLIPLYHTVSDDHLPHISNLYPIKSVKVFKQDLEFFLKHFEPIDLQTFLNGIQNPGGIKRKSFLLTFDDGLREFHDVVAPILREKGIPCINFLNSGFLDNQALFYRHKASLLMDQLPAMTEKQKSAFKQCLQAHQADSTNFNKALASINYHQQELLDELATIAGVDFNAFLKQNQPYMNSKQIQSLLDEGFEFGGHSIDHPEYRQISLEAQVRQTEASIDAFTDRFSLPNRAFAFPFTDEEISLQFFQTVFDNNPHLDASFGGAGLKIDDFPRNFQRIPMEYTDYRGKEIIHLELLYFLFKKLLGKHKIHRN